MHKKILLKQQERFLSCLVLLQKIHYKKGSVMKIKLIIAAAIATFMLSNVYAEWAKSITYTIKVVDKSEWGIGGVSGISNNQGKAGLLTGDSSDFILCPSMPYGVKTWKESIPKEYVCDKDAIAAAHKEQADGLKNAATCQVTTEDSGTLVDLNLFFEGVESFIKGIDDAAEKLVAAFPDLSKGEGYTSEGYVQICKAPANKNAVDQLTEVTNNISKTLNIAGYFPKNQFVFFVDFTNYISSEDEKKNLALWTAAVKENKQFSIDKNKAIIDNIAALAW